MASIECMLVDGGDQVVVGMRRGLASIARTRLTCLIDVLLIGLDVKHTIGKRRMALANDMVGRGAPFRSIDILLIDSPTCLTGR